MRLLISAMISKVQAELLWTAVMFWGPPSILAFETAICLETLPVSLIFCSRHVWSLPASLSLAKQILSAVPFSSLHPELS